MKSPDEVDTIRERVEAYQAVGFSHVVVGVPTAYHEGLVEEIAKQVEPLVK